MDTSDTIKNRAPTWWNDPYIEKLSNIETWPETPGKTPNSWQQVFYDLLRALHNTRDRRLNVPSEGRSKCG